MLFRAHWHGELAVRLIKPDPKLDEVEFLNQLKNQVRTKIFGFLNKVESLSFYSTGISIEKSST